MQEGAHCSHKQMIIMQAAVAHLVPCGFTADSEGGVLAQLDLPIAAFPKVFAEHIRGHQLVISHLHARAWSDAGTTCESLVSASWSVVIVLTCTRPAAPLHGTCNAGACYATMLQMCMMKQQMPYEIAQVSREELKAHTCMQIEPIMLMAGQAADLCQLAILGHLSSQLSC